MEIMPRACEGKNLWNGNKNPRWLCCGVWADFRETVEELDWHISGDHCGHQKCASPALRLFRGNQPKHHNKASEDSDDAQCHMKKSKDRQTCAHAISPQ